MSTPAVYASEVGVASRAPAVSGSASFGQRAAARIAETVIWCYPVVLLIALASKFLDLDVHPQVLAWLVLALALVTSCEVVGELSGPSCEGPVPNTPFFGRL